MKETVDDLAKMKEFNEPSLLHEVRHRYYNQNSQNNENYTPNNIPYSINQNNNQNNSYLHENNQNNQNNDMNQNQMYTHVGSDILLSINPNEDLNIFDGECNDRFCVHISINSIVSNIQ